MIRTLRDNLWFLVPWAVLLITTIGMMAALPRIELHLALNSCHTEAADTFFRIFTNVGGNLPWVVCAAVLIWKLWAGLYLTAGQVIGTIIVYPLKHLFAHPRPLTVFAEAGVELPTVAGVSLHAWNSFPSGHTVAAFALMFGLAAMLPRWWQKLLCFVVAALAAYSRIYLSQHFLDDVVAGSVIGIVSTLLAGMFLRSRRESAQ